MVKIQTAPNVYAVSANGILHWIKDEATATALYGADWNTHVDDIPDVFFSSYTIGSDINTASD